MTNKPMLSVERELLERAASAIEKHHGSLQWVIASDLRAIIDKPVNFLTPDCPDCACVQDGQCLCIPSKPAAQHQPEPVSYTTAGMLEIAKRLPLTGRIGAKATKDERWNIPLFLGPTEQPAPVAVVIPEFESAFEAWWESEGQYCRAGCGSYEKTFAYRAYEAALAEVTRLNTPQ